MPCGTPQSFTVMPEPDKTDQCFWHNTMTRQSTQIKKLNRTSPVLIGSKTIKNKLTFPRTGIPLRAKLRIIRILYRGFEQSIFLFNF